MISAYDPDGNSIVPKPYTMGLVLSQREAEFYAGGWTRHNRGKVASVLLDGTVVSQWQNGKRYSPNLEKKG